MPDLSSDERDFLVKMKSQLDDDRVKALALDNDRVKTLAPDEQQFLIRMHHELDGEPIVTTGKGELWPDWDARREALDSISNGAISSASPTARQAQKAWESQNGVLAFEMRELPGPLLVALATTVAGRAALAAAEAVGAPTLGEILAGTFGRDMSGLQGVLARLGSRAASGAAQGAISQAVYPGGSEDNMAPFGPGYTGSAEQGALINMLTGALGGPLRSHITPEVAALAKRYINAGVPVNTSQIPGAPFAARALARLLGIHRYDLPMLTKEMLRSMGHNGDMLTQDAIDQARRGIGNTLNNAANGVGILSDPKLQTDLRNVALSAKDGLAGQDAAWNQLKGMLAPIYRAANSGQLDGTTYQNITQKGSALANALDRTSPIRQYAMPVREALDDALERANPQAAQDIRLARNQWRNSIILEDMLGKKNAVDENNQINPKFLFNSIASNYDTTGKASQAATRAQNPVDVGTLAEGSNVFRSQPGIHLGLTGSVGLGTFGAGLLAEHEGIPLGELAMEHPIYAGGMAALGGLYGLLGAGMNTTPGRNFLLWNSLRGGAGPIANPLIPAAHNLYRGEDAPRNGINFGAFNPVSSAYGASIPYQDTINGAASQYGVSPLFLARQINQESNFNPNIGTSSTGARGIAQFEPGTARTYGVNVNDPRSSIYGAAHYMSDLTAQFNGNVGLAHAAYNWGPSKVHRWLANGADITKMPMETRNYVSQITGQPIETWLSGSQAPGTGGQGTINTPNITIQPAAGYYANRAAAQAVGAVGGGQDYNMLTGSQ